MTEYWETDVPETLAYIEAENDRRSFQMELTMAHAANLMNLIHALGSKRRKHYTVDKLLGRKPKRSRAEADMALPLRERLRLKKARQAERERAEQERQDEQRLAEAERWGERWMDAGAEWWADGGEA